MSCRANICSGEASAHSVLLQSSTRARLGIIVLKAQLPKLFNRESNLVAGGGASSPHSVQSATLWHGEIGHCSLFSGTFQTLFGTLFIGTRVGELCQCSLRANFSSSRFSWHSFFLSQNMQTGRVSGDRELPLRKRLLKLRILFPKF